jgi:hypothetical protein
LWDEKLHTFLFKGKTQGSLQSLKALPCAPALFQVGENFCSHFEAFGEEERAKLQKALKELSAQDSSLKELSDQET